MNAAPTGNVAQRRLVIVPECATCTKVYQSFMPFTWVSGAQKVPSTSPYTP